MDSLSESVGRSLAQEVSALKASVAHDVNAMKDEVTAMKEMFKHNSESNAHLRSSLAANGNSTKHPVPHPASRHGRNLVVCIDGTLNKFSVKNTNVVELYHRLIQDENQLTFYASGTTYATPRWKLWKYFKQAISDKLNLALALNFEAILLRAYRWLSDNYEEGDLIFVFGFSRGAYQIRTLAAMIDTVGLIRRGNQDQIPFAYDLYSQSMASHPQDISRHFKDTFSHKDVRVHFAGAWDTVSSVGFIRDKTLPGTTDGMQNVTFFRHALALHERRVKFLQENARGGLGPTAEATRRGRNGEPPHTKEVWFAGAHGDIGGGAVWNLEMNQFGPALRWMMFEGAIAGLRLTDAPQQWENDQPLIIHDKLQGYWQLFEYIPFARLAYTDAKSTTRRLHHGHPRVIQPNQLIHATALRCQSFGRATLPPGIEWSSLQDNHMVEEDPYDTAKGLIERINSHLVSAPTETIGAHEITALKMLISTKPGIKSLRDTPAIDDTLMALILLYSKPTEPDLESLRIVVDATLTVMALNAAVQRDQNYSTDRLSPIIAHARQHGNVTLAERLETLFQSPIA